MRDFGLVSGSNSTNNYMLHKCKVALKKVEWITFHDIGINHELIFIIILGILSSYIAILFNHVLSKLIFLRVKLKNPLFSNRWRWGPIVALFIGFPVHFMHYGETKMCDMFFSEKDMTTLKGIIIFTQSFRW